MAEIEASLLAKVQSVESSYDRPVLIGFLKGRKKRVGTLIEATSNQSLKELKREIKKKGGKKLKVYKEISTIYAEMPVDKVQDLASVSCAQKVYDAEGDVKLSLYKSVPLVMGVEKWQLPYRVKGHKLEGKGVKVAVIDSGIDKSHPDFGWFGWRVQASKNFSGGRASRGREHGTHVAGIIAGSGKASGYRYVGVAPKAILYDVKVFMNGETPTTRDTIIEATLWAVKKHVDVINMSFGDNHGCTDGTCPLCKTADYAVSKGITVVAAAGNVGPAEGTISCPGNAKDVITVGATTKTEPVVVTSYSSRGSTRQFDKPDLVAPGEKITAPQPGKTYATMTGTSMAAPHVSGMAALLHQSSKYTQGKAQNSPAEIKQTLQRSSINLGEHKTAQGSGLVNFKNHLVSLQKFKKRRWWEGTRPGQSDTIYTPIPENFIKIRNILSGEDDVKKLKIALLYDKEFTDIQLRQAVENAIGIDKCHAHYEAIRACIIRKPVKSFKKTRQKSKKGLNTIECDMNTEHESSTCPASIRMFCPHYDQHVCNNIYESCIHYQLANHAKILKMIMK